MPTKSDTSTTPEPEANAVDTPTEETPVEEVVEVVENPVAEEVKNVEPEPEPTSEPEPAAEAVAVVEEAPEEEQPDEEVVAEEPSATPEPEPEPEPEPVAVVGAVSPIATISEGSLKILFK